MNVSLIKRLYEEDLIAVHDSFPTWQDAVLASVEPMVKAGMVTEQYGRSILKHVEEYGPYIFLAPHICMPHCRDYEQVKRPGICFMKCNKPVIADPDDPEMGAELFFAIAAKEAGEHLDVIQYLVETIGDDESVESLLHIKSMKDIEELIKTESE